MEFRKATEEDLGAILMIIKQAQEFMKKQGLNQWQDGYPNSDVISQDIKDQNSYVLLEGNVVKGTAAVSFDGEDTYEKIYDGAWITHGDYVVIHRIAVEEASRGTGLSTVLVKNIEELCNQRGIKSIKIDTHEDNKPMQSLLLNNEFKYCGIIYLIDGSKRIAFEKVL